MRKANEKKKEKIKERKGTSTITTVLGRWCSTNPFLPTKRKRNTKKVLGNDQKEKQNPAEENNKVISKKRKGTGAVAAPFL